MTTHTAHATARPSTLAVVGGTAAIAGQVILLLSACLLPIFSEYDVTRDFISELVLGRFGWVQTVAFVASGLGVVALALALGRSGISGRGARLGPVLIGIFGTGAIVSAVFATDPVDGPPDISAMTITGLVHATAAAVSFVSVLTAMFLLSRTFARNDSWRSIWPWSLALGIVALLAFLVSGTGLGQRLLVTAIAAWLILVAQRLLTSAASTSVNSSTPERHLP